VLEGITQIADQTDTRVHYALGCPLWKNSYSGLAFPDDRISEALAATRASDAIVLCLGLDADIEGEQGDTGNEYSSGDKNHLDLPGRQQHLLEEVVKAADGKPVILVCMSGSALAITWADENVNGIIQSFYPGAMGGQAIAEIIAGRVNPSGKLPVTFYRSTDDLPDFSDYDMTGRTYRYYYGEALYPFGFGLSYTNFGLDVLEAGREKCRVRVTNTGDRDGIETVQIYAENPGQKEKHSLCGVQTVKLSPGEAKEVEVVISPAAFSRRDANGDLYELDGTQYLHIGFSQPDARGAKLRGIAPTKIALE